VSFTTGLNEPFGSFIAGTRGIGLPRPIYDQDMSLRCQALRSHGRKALNVAGRQEVKNFGNKEKIATRRFSDRIVCRQKSFEKAHVFVFSQALLGDSKRIFRCVDRQNAFAVLRKRACTDADRTSKFYGKGNRRGWQAVQNPCQFLVFIWTVFKIPWVRIALKQLVEDFRLPSLVAHDVMKSS